MSVVVQDGYIYEGSGGIEGFLREAERLRVRAAAACRGAVSAELGARAARLLDRRALGCSVDSRLSAWADSHGPLRAVFLSAAESRRDTLARGIRDPANDWECRVIAYPLRIGPVLVRLPTEKPDVYGPEIERIEGIRSFWCDSRTDGQPDVPRAEWRRRLALWGAAVCQDALRSGAPFSIALVGEEGFEPDAEEAAERQPELSARAAKAAKEALRSEFADRVCAAAAGAGAGASPYRLAMLVLSGFEEHIETAEGAAELMTRAQCFARRLKARYTAADFRCPPPQSSPECDDGRRSP